MGYQRIDAWCIAFVFPVLKRSVQCSDIFSSEALYDKDYHILFRHLKRVCWYMYRRIDGFHLFLTVEIVGNDKHVCADGANQ